MNSKILSALFALLLITFSCNKTSTEITNSGDEGTLKVSVTGDFELTDQTKSSETDGSNPWLDANNYSILIKKNGESYAGWTSVSEMPEEVKLQPNDYDIVAWWGSNVAADFDSPFYYGDQSFTIESSEVTEVSIEASLMNAIIDVVFTDNFLSNFSSYSYIAVELHNEYTGSSPLSITPDETRTAYVSPTELYLKLYLEKSDGTSLYYGLATIDEVLAKDKITVTLDSEVTAATTLGFNVNISDETNRVDQTEIIDFDDIIYSQPEIKLSFASPLLITEGNPEDLTDQVSYIKSVDEIKSLTLKHSSAALTAAGISSEVSLLNASNVAQLEALGITVEVDDSYRSSLIYFNEFIATTKVIDRSLDSETHSFEIEVTNINNVTTSKSFDIQINKYTFDYDIPAIPAGLIWTMEATAYAPTTDAMSQDEFMEGVTCELSGDGGSSWSELSLNSDGNYSMTGLTADTDYQVKYSYDGTSGGIVEFTTLPVLDVTNNGLEDYTSELQSYYSSNAPVYDYTFTGWGTNNATTMSAAQKYNYCCWPSTLATTDSSVGSTAALVQTIGYGSGNTVVTTSSTNCSYIASGMLYLGSSESDGESFASKPTAMTYDYMFDIYNSQPHYVEVRVENRTGSTTTVLGEGSFSSTTVVSAYTQKSIDITYNSGNEDLAPTHIVVNFRSAESTSLSVSDVQVVRGSVGVTYPLDEGYIDTIYRGSRLWVDNIQFEYNK